MTAIGRVAAGRQERLQEHLTALIREHTGKLQALRQRLAAVSQEPGTDDSFAEHADADVTVTLLESHEAVIQRARRALERLEAGSYGACEDCESPISENRLMATPDASRCLDCQERAEAGIPARRFTQHQRSRTPSRPRMAR